MATSSSMPDPIPIQARAAAGQRAHRLEPDHVTVHVVRRIFELFVSGHGLRAIAQLLTDEGIPSPSAHDPRRNTHRDPRGWALSAVRAILANEAYTGRRVWAKQERSKSSSTRTTSLPATERGSSGATRTSGSAPTERIRP